MASEGWRIRVSATATSEARTGLSKCREWFEELLRSAALSFRAQWASLVADVGVALPTMWCLFQLARRLTYSNISYDEEYFLWTGWNINKGLVPYRDFTEFKPLGLFLINALSLRIFGLGNQRYRYLITGLALTSLGFLLFALMRRRVPRLFASALVLAIAALWFDTKWHDSSLNDAESLGMTWFLMATAALVAPPSRATEVLGGAFLSFAVLCKEPFALPAVGLWLFVGTWRYHEQGTWKRVFTYVKSSVMGGALVAAAVLLYMAPTGALSSYVRLLISYRKFTSTICVDLGRWTPMDFWPAMGARWDRLHAELVDIFKLWPLVPYYFGTFAVVRARSVPLVVGAVLVTALGLAAVTIGGCFWNHYYMLGMTGLFAVCAVGAAELGGLLSAGSARLRTFASILAIVITGGVLYPRIEAESQAIYTPPPYPTPASVIDFVVNNSKPTDRIFTTGAPGLYVFANRRSSLVESAILDEFLSLYPGATDEERVAPLRSQLEANPPKVVYVDPVYASRKTRHVASLVDPFLRQHGYVRVNDAIFLRAD